MSLLLHKYSVSSVDWGIRTGISQGHLSIDKSALLDRLQQLERRLAGVDVHLVRPGDKTRIVCVKDVIGPRIKKEDPAAGTDTLCILDNVAVVTCGPIVGYQEGIIDMSGPGAPLSPYAEHLLLVLDLGFSQTLSPQEHEEAVRTLGLDAARYIAEACLEAKPDEIEDVSWPTLPEGTDLPRIGYVYLVLSQGLLHDTYVFGKNAKAGLPISADPVSLFDNAIISGNCVSACDKNTTYNHQNNPVIGALLKGHGSRWNFVGTVITNSPTTLPEKEASAAKTIALINELGADGAIVSKEGFGNPDSDLMMLLRGLEQAGVKTVAITDEFAGIEGDSQSLADSTPEADAVVSTGNANEQIELPAMAKTIGPLPDASRLSGGYPHSLRPDGSMVVELQAIVGATNELGCSRLSCREI